MTRLTVLTLCVVVLLAACDYTMTVRIRYELPPCDSLPHAQDSTQPKLPCMLAKDSTP